MRQRTPTPAGTQRRLQALMARSWSMEAIAHETGLRAPKLARALENPATIPPKLADGVIAAYDRLWDKTPPRATPEQLELAEAAVTVARQRGWATLYWHPRADNPARRLYDAFTRADDFVRYRIRL